MGLFDFFKKKNSQATIATDNGLPGPTFLDGFTKHIDSAKDIQPHEWRRQIVSSNGNTKFRIKYYGDILGKLSNVHKPVEEEYKDLIVATDFSPAKVYAVDTINNEEILLFDGCKHGYNALLCDTYTLEQINNRDTSTIFKDRYNCDVFEIIISTYNGIDFEEEFLDDVDDNGSIELVDGSKIDYLTFKCNSYDTLQILGVNENQNLIKIVEEELA